MMFGRFKRLFFVGIGGAGMSGIAEILHNLGYQIKGSDTTPSEITEYLDGLGITVSDRHHGDNIADSDVVVISSAVGEDNPEVEEARRLGLPVIKRAEMLGELMRLKFSVAIAGTHGKTTTTSMIGRILRHTQLHPTLIVGGVVSELGTGADLGEGDYMVVEADEYDRSIAKMFPSMAVVLNVEADHLDCYDDLDDLRGAFLSFINRVPFYGSAVISADDENLSLMRDKIGRPYVTFGTAVSADYRAVDIDEQPGRTTFSVYRRGDLLGEVILHVPGRHNALNALAAVAAAAELDVPFETITDALLGFTGVSRRFETVGEVNDVIVIDDYAHHPTEIAACLDTARRNFQRRVIAVFQPHLYSRTQTFLTEFAEALSKADHCILTDIYPAREEPIPGITSDSIRKEAVRLGYKNFEYVGRKKHAAEAVARQSRSGDVVLIIGAGSITHIRQPVLKALETIA
jgi:UDP-N-acetylmuramate--alanine ligase